MLNQNLERISANPRGSARDKEVILEKLHQPLVTDKGRRSVRMNSSDHVHMGCQRRCNPQEYYNSARQRHWNFHTKAHDSVVAVRRPEGVDRAFPLKPVHHKRAPTVWTQDFDQYELQNFSGLAHSRGQAEVIRNGKTCNTRAVDVPLLSQEQLSDGIREVAGSQRPRKDWHRLPSDEQQVARAIHEKELILQEAVQRFRGKLRQNIQMQMNAAAAGDVKNSEKEKRAEQEKGWRESRVTPPEQHRREPVKSRETAREDKRQEDIKEWRKNQDAWNNDRMRNAHEEGRSRWDRRETEITQKPQSKRDGDRGTQEIISHQRMENGELNRWRWNKVKEKEQNRRKAGNERDSWMGGETRVRSLQEKERAKDREQSHMCKENVDWTREKRYKEITSKDRYGSKGEGREQDIPQKSQQKSAGRLAAESHSGKGRRTHGEPSLAPVSGPSQSSRMQQSELIAGDGADTSLQVLPCKICHRTFSAERLEKHFKICEKMQQSQRKVFNSYSHRTKGTSLEAFLKTHTRSKTPETKNNWRHNHEVFIRNMRQGRLPGGTSEPKPSVQANPDYVTCPHCSRQFGPAPAERHIPKCQHIKSRPPPPRYRQ